MNCLNVKFITTPFIYDPHATVTVLYSEIDILWMEECQLVVVEFFNTIMILII